MEEKQCEAKWLSVDARGQNVARESYGIAPQRRIATHQDCHQSGSGDDAVVRLHAALPHSIWYPPV
jgi:hypothetical protein